MPPPVSHAAAPHTTTTTAKHPSDTNKYFVTSTRTELPPRTSSTRSASPKLPLKTEVRRRLVVCRAKSVDSHVPPPPPLELAPAAAARALTRARVCERERRRHRRSSGCPAATATRRDAHRVEAVVVVAAAVTSTAEPAARIAAVARTNGSAHSSTGTHVCPHPRAHFATLVPGSK